MSADEPTPAPQPPTPQTPPPPPPSSSAVPATPTYATAPGAPAATHPTFPNGKPAVNELGEPVAVQSRLAAALLCWFLGVFGVHRFYVGKVGTGILMIFTLGGLGIWALIDFIMILMGSFRNKEGKKLYNW